MAAAGLLLAATVGPATAGPGGVATPAPATSEWGCGDWGMLGRTLTRRFSVDGCAAAIRRGTVARLVPKWVFRPDLDVGDQATFTASPAIVGDRVYIGGWNGVMYALDRETGVPRWHYRTQAAPGATFGPIVSSAAVTDTPARGRLVIFGAGPWVYALDADDGALVWRHHVGSGIPDDPAEVESSPVVWHNTVYVGMDVHDRAGDESGGVRGGLLALDVNSGARRWKHEPEVREGVPASGCGGVWSSPTIDIARGRVYFATANCYAASDDARLPMEEVTALDAGSGAHVWTFHPHVPAQNDDLDFGATPNLFVDATGREVVGAGNKDGRYYALDPRTGALVWRSNQLSQPAPGVGGFIGSPAVTGGRVFGSTAIGTPPSYHALDPRARDAAGEVAPAWRGLASPSYAASAATGGLVFAGALDNVLKAFDTDTGLVRWAFPLAGPISSGPAIAGDLLVIGSGTSSSDLCAKGRPGSEACFLVFDTVLGQQGAVHAFQLAG